MYLSKSGCNWEKVFVFAQGGFIRVKWLFLGKVVVFVLSGCTRVKLVAFRQRSCI